MEAVEAAGELAAVPLARLEAAVGEADAQWLSQLARGIDLEEARTPRAALGAGLLVAGSKQTSYARNDAEGCQIKAGLLGLLCEVTHMLGYSPLTWWVGSVIEAAPAGCAGEGAAFATKRKLVRFFLFHMSQPAIALSWQ